LLNDLGSFDAKSLEMQEETMILALAEVLEQVLILEEQLSEPSDLVSAGFGVLISQSIEEIFDCGVIQISISPWIVPEIFQRL
jgi:hypothetical protein